jgi:O-antigen/teichoic acid export membrane protein
MSLIARDRPGAYARLLVPVIVLNIALNLGLIPRFGSDGAAFVAMLSSLILAILAMWQAQSVVGSSDLTGAFAGPLLGAAAMAGAVLALRLPWPFELVLGFAAYSAVLVAFEWLIRRDDARVYLRVLPDRLWSRSRVDRTAA